MHLSPEEIHHLKSPLTSLRLGLDLLQKKMDSSADPEEIRALAGSLEEKASLLGDRLETFLEKCTKEPPPLG